jgi:hypothetical protein
MMVPEELDVDPLFSVDDESRTSGFTVKSLRGRAIAVTSGAFVGSHDAPCR